jgi:alkylation response protein AidB-like acyl-CoA dehydrogenase
MLKMLQRNGNAVPGNRRLPAAVWRYGYTSEYPISRAFADARVQRIYGGTSEIMKEVIARSILGRA